MVYMYVNFNMCQQASNCINNLHSNHLIYRDTGRVRKWSDHLLCRLLLAMLHASCGTTVASTLVEYASPVRDDDTILPHQQP